MYLFSAVRTLEDHDSGMAEGGGREVPKRGLWGMGMQACRSGERVTSWLPDNLPTSTKNDRHGEPPVLR